MDHCKDFFACKNVRGETAVLHNTGGETKVSKNPGQPKTLII